MTTARTTGGAKPPRDPDCFEQWLCERLREQPDRQDEVGRVARWVLRENKEGRWAPGTILLARHGHAYDVPAHYGRVLRHAGNLPEETIEVFFRVYDLYLKDDGAEYDRMVEERGRGLDEEFIGQSNDNGEGGNGDGGDGTSTGADAPVSESDWLSENLFFNHALGSEQTGYEVDEDGWPLEEELTDEGRE